MAVTSRQGGGQFKSQPMKHLRGMEEIKIRINIKMQTDIKYIPALGSSVVKKMYLKKSINARNAAEK